MEEWSFMFGVLGNITTALIHLSSVNTFLRIVKNRSTEEFESFPYVALLLNASLWTYYGITKPDSLLVATVNGSGVVVQIIQLSLFLLYAPPKTKAKTAAMVAIMDVGFMTAIVLGTKLGMEGESRIQSIGFVSTCFTILSYASPLFAMKTVMTTKSVEYMPVSLSFFMCLNGITWTTYSVLDRDYFIGVSNGSGLILGGSQLIVYAMYRNAKPSKRRDGILEEGWEHEKLIDDKTADV